MTIPFPEPVQIAGRNFYYKGRLRCWRAQVAGEPAPAPQPDDEVLISTNQVRDLFGGVSDMWIWRKRQKAPAMEGANV